MSMSVKEFTRRLIDQLKLARRTGKIVFGYRSTLRAVQRGFAKGVICSSDCPEDRWKLLAWLCKLANIPFLRAPLDCMHLGEAIGRPHRVSALAILDPGTSEILKVITQKPY